MLATPMFTPQKLTSLVLAAQVDLIYSKPQHLTKLFRTTPDSCMRHNTIPS